MAYISSMRTPTALGGLLWLTRDSKGISQRELSVRSGVSQPMISAIEQGRVEPRLSTVQTLLAAMGCELRIDAVPLNPADSTTVVSASQKEEFINKLTSKQPT